MTVNDKINELRKLNYYVKQDSRDFPNPFLLLSDNQALNKLLVEGQGKPKIGAEVIQGSDDTQEVYDIGAANSRRERARHVREQQDAANAGINHMRSRVNALAKDRADLASINRMDAMKSLFVREPSGASRHHANRMAAYQDDTSGGGGGGGGGGLRPEQMTGPQIERQVKLSASKGRGVVKSKAQEEVNNRRQALDKAIKAVREGQGEPKREETRFEKARRERDQAQGLNLRGKK